MNNNLKIGLWLPPRTNLNASIKLENPAHIDSTLCNLFIDYLKSHDVKYYQNLDFRHAVIKNNQVFIDDFCMSQLDHFVWMGCLDRALDSYHLEVLRALEFSTKIHNSYSFFNVATDKFSAFSILHNHGIPVPELYLTSPDNIGFMEPLFEKSAYLLKPRRSSFGIGIIKVDQFEQLRDIVEYHSNKSYYLEKFYPNNLNDWTGVTVFNGTVLYGFRKNSSKVSGWKVYDKQCQGGEVIYVKPNQEIEKIAIKIGEILGANYFGLDFIKTAEGYKIVDINCSPGMYYDMIHELELPIAELFFKMLPIN